MGGSQQYVQNLDEVLFAFDAFNSSEPYVKVALKLTGPPTTSVNEGVTLNVRDGATGDPIAGATVNQSTTDNMGNVTITFGEAGLYLLKAEKDGSIRSNVLRMQVS